MALRLDQSEDGTDTVTLINPEFSLSRHQGREVILPRRLDFALKCVAVQVKWRLWFDGLSLAGVEIGLDEIEQRGA